MCVNHDKFICSTIYPLGNDLYIVDLDTRLKTYAYNSAVLITVDTIEISVDSLSPITFDSAQFYCEGCSGATFIISPDKKLLSINFPNFFSYSSNMQLNESNCKMFITLHMDIENTCLPLVLNYKVIGQAIVDNNAVAKLLLGCKVLKVLESPYANNYLAEKCIKLKSFVVN